MTTQDPQDQHTPEQPAPSPPGDAPETDPLGTPEAPPDPPPSTPDRAAETAVPEVAEAPPDPPPSTPDRAAETAVPEPAEAPPDPAEVGAVAEEFLQGLVSAMNLEAEVAVHVEEDTAYVDVNGDDLGILIGRRGQTLDGVQEITRTAVQRRLKARVRLMVDVEGYRARRQESLAEYARSMARRAQERGTEIELEPMNAYERKIVHDAVAEVEGATSFSEGEEPYRKVIVRGT